MTDDPGPSAYSIDEDDQLQPEDTLQDLGVDDVLDRGYSPPDREPASMKHGMTPREEREGETLDERLAEEVPDVGERDTLRQDGDPDPERSGRLVAPDEGRGPDAEADAVATDVGIDGAAASAEEAAVHYTDDGDEV